VLAHEHAVARRGPGEHLDLAPVGPGRLEAERYRSHLALRERRDEPADHGVEVRRPRLGVEADHRRLAVAIEHEPGRAITFAVA